METLSLFFYSILKAFLPLPSLEVMLIPLVINNPNLIVWYSLIGALGTYIGGSIGYGIAYFLGNSFVLKLTNNETMEKGMDLVNKYGVLAVFIGGITPIPDFILAYLAGLTRMNHFLFAISDAVARLLRSLLVSYTILMFGYVIDFDKWGSIISLVIIIYFVLKWGFGDKEKL